MSLILEFDWYTDGDYYIDIENIISSMYGKNNITYSIHPDEDGVNTSLFILTGDSAKQEAIDILLLLSSSIQCASHRLFVRDYLITMFDKAVKELREHVGKDSVNIQDYISGNYDGTELAIWSIDEEVARTMQEKMRKTDKREKYLSFLESMPDGELEKLLNIYSVRCEEAVRERLLILLS